jgi:LmbE family N-acetylglucosaminyl deacetylase
MLALSLDALATPGRHLLCLGAHADDIEIGCGGTILKLLDGQPDLKVTWVVFSGEGGREGEALASAEAMLQSAGKREVIVKQFRDGFFPAHFERIKECFEELKAVVSPDLVFTHYRGDLHQDHRLVAELTWNTFRDHLILEYEIPKFDGDLGSPNAFVPLDRSVCQRKIQTILGSFPSQATRSWFSEDTFYALLRLRGLEANAPSRHAEAFYCRKLLFDAARV